jgi:hypothetical protein
MKSCKRTVVLALAFAPAIFATGLPVLTSTQWQLTYFTNPTFTGAYTPINAVVNLGAGLYGTPVGGGSQSHILVENEVGAGPLCYAVNCPAQTTAYPQPNYVFTIGIWGFSPQNIVPGTGVSSLVLQTTFTGELNYQNTAAPFPSGLGTATLYTGLDAGGTTDYYYFINADGTVTNTLHVPIGDSDGVNVNGVLLDPPNDATLVLDILGFSNPTGNSTITATIPEPGTSGPAAIAIIGLAVIPFLRRCRA